MVEDGWIVSQEGEIHFPQAHVIWHWRKKWIYFSQFSIFFLVIPCNDKESSSVEGNVFLFAAVGTILVCVDSELNGYIGDMS